MTDLEMTRLCAEAMGFDYDAEYGKVQYWPNEGRAWDGNIASEYRPLHDDAQAMALVKRHKLIVKPKRKPGRRSPSGSDMWFACAFWEVTETVSADLNRAIVECVAKMQAAKVTA